jgi:hypothetical protein
MPEDLIDRLRRSDPAAEPDPAATERDAQIWERVRAVQAPARKPRRAAQGLAIVAGVALLVGAMALGIGRDRRPGGDFDAAAKAFTALDPRHALYHFRSVARLTEQPAGVARGYVVSFQFPFVGPSRGGRPSYDEVWLTPGGHRVRWLRYRGAGGSASGLLRASAFVQPLPRAHLMGVPKARLPRIRAQLRAHLREPACPDPRRPDLPGDLISAGLLRFAPPSDPATAFVVAYCAGRIQSQGAAVLDGQPVWRFVSRPSAHGSWQEWLVERRSWLPVRYRYVDQNQQGGQRYKARLTVRFLVFEVLPLDSGSTHLLHLTSAERAVCLAAKRRALARLRRHLSPRRYRMAVGLMRRHNDCL